MPQNPRILIIEGDGIVREQLAVSLRLASYEVFESTNGKEGLRMFSERHPQLVLVALQLTDIDGLEVCRVIKQSPDRRESSVILLSHEPPCWPGESHAGPDDFLVKPVATVELLARIKLDLRLRKTTDALRVSHELQDHLLKAIPDAVLLISLQGQLLRANPKAIQLLGYTDETELIERSAYGLVQPEERQQFRCLLALTVAAEATHDRQFKVLKKRGGSLSVDISTTLVNGSCGFASTLLCVLRQASLRHQPA